MPAQRAKVTSVEAIQAFKTALVIYIDKAGRILDEVSNDIMRTRVWLETDCPRLCANEIRQRSKDLAQAEQELMTARLSALPSALQARRMTVDKARTALREAEYRLGRVKNWIRQYESRVETPAKTVAQLRHALDYDMKKAVAFLNGAVSSLAAYAEMTPPPQSPSADTPDTNSMAEQQSSSQAEPDAGASSGDKK